MEIRFSAEGTDRDRDLQSLRAWLADDRELRLNGVRIEAAGRPQPGEMGVSPDWIGAVCAAVPVAQLVVTGIRSWLRGRGPSSTILFHVHAPEADAEHVRQALMGLGLVPRHSDSRDDEDAAADDDGDQR